MTSSSLALAIDVGGTTIKGELCDDRGTACAETRVATPKGDVAREAIIGVGQDLLARAPGPVTCAGVAVPGLVDAERGVGIYSANIGWRDIELRNAFEAAWGLPVRLGNDVAAGGVAEHLIGAGRGHDHMVYVPVGTGLAATIISGGRLVTGPLGQIAELGHVPVRPGTPCACGGDGCVEAVASASAIARTYTRLTGQAVTGAYDVAARLHVDDVAASVWQDAIEALADAIGIITLMTAPTLVVLGGGLSEAGDLLLTPLRAAVTDRSRINAAPTLVAGTFGGRAGVVGAGLLARGMWGP